MDLNAPHFLQSEYSPSTPDAARFHIIPAPLEKSVSYGSGTARGPAAILDASMELEAFDGASLPGEDGLYTAPPINCDEPIETVLETIASRMKVTFDMGSVPILLGGEHTVSVGAFTALKRCFNDVGIVQFDAHADLRKTYRGNPFSHACVMHHALDLEIPFFQIGVRSLSHPEHLLRSERGIPHVDAAVLAKDGLSAIRLPDEFPSKIYVTFDVDALDPSIMPSTGTPEQGGLLWYDAMRILKSLTETRTIVGFDCTELAPIDGLHAPDFAAARLIYNVMGFISRGIT